MAAATENLRQRTKEDEPLIATSKGRTAHNRKMAMAKRGLRSLTIGIAIPIALTLLTKSLSGSGQKYQALAKPFWYPPLWALNLACMGWSLLMGLSGWLVWAEGGFHKEPMAVPLYAGQLVLGLLWDPVVFGFEARRMGLVICLGLIGLLIGCMRSFRAVNPIAGDLVKPCLGWVAYLTLVNFKLLQL